MGVIKLSNLGTSESGERRDASRKRVEAKRERYIYRERETEKKRERGGGGREKYKARKCEIVSIHARVSARYVYVPFLSALSRAIAFLLCHGRARTGGCRV